MAAVNACVSGQTELLWRAQPTAKTPTRGTDVIRPEPPSRPGAPSPTPVTPSWRAELSLTEIRAAALAAAAVVYTGFNGDPSEYVIRVADRFEDYIRNGAVG